MKIVKYLNYILIILSLSGLSACANRSSLNHSNPHEKTEPVQEINIEKENRDYVFHLGDVIDIKLFYNPELNDTVTVRPDGKISLQLIDQIKVEGLTPSELDRIITEEYSKKLRNVEVTVIVRDFGGQRIFIGGEVNSPGLIPIFGNLTTIQAIFQAGGFKDTAELKSVVVLRNQGTLKPLFMTINLAEDLSSDTQSNDIVLEPYDIVFVPKSQIAKMNQFVDQYIDKLIPISRSLGIYYNLNPGRGW
ncbi:MAG: hypothetical protein AMK70_00620 [Nitrospira bacterium SG8_35_1]|nr:MAG: hypothetical protein AMK70_00620 [Nitrospira bacterium SG8_35_1]